MQKIILWAVKTKLLPFFLRILADKLHQKIYGPTVYNQGELDKKPKVKE